MTVAQRLTLLISVALAALTGLGVLAYVQMNRAYEAADFGNEVIVPALLNIGDINEFDGAVRVEIRNHLLAADAETSNEAEKVIASKREQLEKALKAYDSAMSDEQSRKLLENLRTTYAEAVN